MAGPFETQFSVGVNDNATPKIRSIQENVRRMQQARERLGVRGEHTIRREIQLTEASLNRMARSGTLGATELARAQEKAAAKITQLQKEMAEAEVRSYTSRNTAREAYTALGIRSEHDIQREIQRTEAAYNRLERSGVLSASEQARAYEKMTSTVGKLRHELGETERTQSRLSKTFKTLGAIGGAVAGATMALRKPITDAASYDSALRKQTNLAYGNSDTAGRESGYRRIDQSIRDSVDSSGASPEEAFSGLETLQRSGVVSTEQSYKFLPYILRNSMATGADAASVANTEASAVNFGLNDNDAPAALSVLTTMAQHGKIGVPELAREMPRGLESGKSAGLYGRRGFSRLSAFFEASAIGAKDPQDAATNANDFLAELSSSNLANNAKRIKINGKGIDIRGAMRYDLAHGKDALDTVTGVIGKIDASDPEYGRLQKKLSHASTDEEREKLNAQIAQIHGQHIAQLFPNQQSRNAYINFDRQRDYFNQMTGEGEDQFTQPDEQRSATKDFNFTKAGPEWENNRAKYNTELTSDAALKTPTDIIGHLMNDLADLEKKFPVLGAAVSGTTTAFKTLASSYGGAVLTGAAGGWGIKTLKNWLGKGGDVVKDGIEATEDIVGGTAGKPGVFGRVGSWLAGGGKRLVSGGADVLSDGLIDNPVTLALAGLIYPSDTV
uniref:phage tail tape measure protein n=1 Tax=Rahnella sp. ChDrAdgB13 TaxID=1850581 RepID=UPI001AD8835F